jgi:hypothetical protein
MMEDDEDVLIFKDDKESEIYQFIKYTVTEIVKKELKTTEEDPTLKKGHETTYGYCQKPFGILRIRIVEFLT